MDEIGDDELMKRAQGGDTVAFDLIVRRHQHKLQRFAARMLGGDSAQAADIAVGAFLRLWETRATYRPCGKLESWLLSTTYRLCLDFLSQRQRSVDLQDHSISDKKDTHGTVEGSALAQAVRDAVMQLPESHRAVLVLAVYEEMAYDEIAAALGIPAGTVASRKNHATKLLRQSLAAWDDPQTPPRQNS